MTGCHSLRCSSTPKPARVPVIAGFLFDRFVEKLG